MERRLTEKRAILYSRVSTSWQAEHGHGLAAQVDICRRWADFNDFRVVMEASDEGVSGTVPPDDRDGLGPVLAALAAGDADVLVVASLSRLGRRTMDVIELGERAQVEGWGLALLDLNIDTSTPTGELVLTIMAAVAQLERKQISERTRAGLAAARKKGVRLGCPASDRTRRAGRRAIELRRQGHTLRSVANQLASEGYRTPRGGKWFAASVSQAIRTVRLDKEAQEAEKR